MKDFKQWWDEAEIFAGEGAMEAAEQAWDEACKEVEEEAICRLIKKVSNEIDWIAPSNFEMIANDLPRIHNN